MSPHPTTAAAPAANAAGKPLVLSAIREGVATLTLNNPARRNTLSMPMMEALIGHLEALRDDPAVRAILIAANGPVFSSGHDLKELVGSERDKVSAAFARSTALMELIRAIPKPVIAQVAGLASAAGCQLIASCDLVVAADTAGFQTPGVMIGLFCSTPMVPLSRAVPAKKAMEMLLTGRSIDAQEAERHGLVNRVVPAPRLAGEADALAREIIQYSAYTIAVGKAAFYKQLPLEECEAYQVGREAMTRNALAEDGQEGMSAFLEKRKPRFKF
jgi:enoyl-CoA hydratase/carnithine racemase